ncbi:MAG: hypothetical protein GY795_48735 [Desulfobacterales bacterium]|nr:hypothetical protein [Desulfobacterales bacterium]
MFSAIQEKVKYGVSGYQGKLKEMSSIINQLIVKYQKERIIPMPYTIEDYRRELREEVLDILTPDEILKKIPAKEFLKKLPLKEILKGFSTEEIESYLKEQKRIKK